MNNSAAAIPIAKNDRIIIKKKAILSYKSLFVLSVLKLPYKTSKPSNIKMTGHSLIMNSYDMF